MRVLAIETSCDETGVCLLEASGEFGPDFRYRVLGNALLSQAALHAEFGGVFPNLAKREHGRNLVPLTTKALEDAGELHPSSGAVPGAALLPLRDLLVREQELFAAILPFLIKHEKPAIDAIAVTAGPGLEPALWVGINFAKALALAWELPLVAVNHMEGHVAISLVENDRLRDFEFPALALLISGGHTELVLSRSFGAYERIGETRDDAAGEAFDKVARLLDLPYPGGPEISKLAARRREHGTSLRFTPPMLNTKDYDFSFSGLKTEARKLAESRAPLNADAKEEIALAFENAVAEVLIKKTMRAVEEYGALALVVGGGVSANDHIRIELASALDRAGNPAQLLIPPPNLATDNALMIALAGYFRAKRGEFAAPESLAASGNLKLQ